MWSFFEEKNQFFMFPCCSTCEDLSIDVSFTNVGMILTKFFRGTDKQTYNVMESLYGNMSHTINFHFRYVHPLMTGMNNK